MFGVAGAMLMYASLCATFLTMGIAAIRAHRSGRRAWLIAVLVAWPLAYVYTLVVDRGAA